jgi:hypothetical protein
MITDRHNIFITEVSREEYQQRKRKQRLKPTTTEKMETIFGIIPVDVSYSIGNFCRQVDESLEFFRKINRLSPKVKRNGRVVFEREAIYLKKDHKKLYSGLADLEGMIRRGRGIDLIFDDEEIPEEDEEEKSERHFYKLKGDNVLLVEIRVPYSVLSNGLYRFTRTTKDAYSLLKATHDPRN